MILVMSSHVERFDAFISYSHAADGRLAPAVQSGLQRLARPVFQRRALHVFRDETGLSTNPHLWGSIESALDASEWFVLLCSPESATSEWVNREVATWLERKPLDHLLVVVTDGSLSFRADGSVDDDVTTCLPRSLVDVLTGEPRWLDLRWARDDAQLDLRNGRFRAAIADLAAPIHGIAKDDLESEDVRQQRRARRLAGVGVAAVAALAVVSLIAALVAFDQRARADAEAVRATAKGLAAQATGLASTDLDLSLLLAAEGHRLDPSLETESGLLAALESARLVDSLATPIPAGIADITMTPDGSTLFVLSSDGSIVPFDPSTLEPIGPPIVEGIVEPWAVVVNNDGSRLGYAGGDGAGVVDIASGEPVANGLGDGPVSVELAPSGRRAVVSGVAMATIQVVDLDTGGVTHEIPTDGEDFAVMLNDSRIAVQTLGGTQLSFHDLLPDGGTEPVSELETVPGGGFALSPDGSVLVAGGLSGTAALIDTETLSTRGPEIRTRGSRTGTFAFSADGSLVVLSSDDGSALIVDAESADTVAELTGLSGTIATEFTGPDRLLSVSLTDGSSATWTLQHRPAIGSAVPIGKGGIVAMRLVDDVDTTVIAYEDRIEIAPSDDVTAPSLVREFGPLIRAMDVAESAGLVAVYALEIDLEAEEVVERRVYVMELDTFEDVAVVTLGDHALENIRLSPDGELLALGARDGQLSVVRSRTGEEVLAPRAADEYPCCLGALVWSPDGTRLHAGGQDGTLRTFDTTTWEQVGEHPLAEGLFALRYSRVTDDGNTIVVPAESGDVFLVDAGSGAPIGDPFFAAGTQLQTAALISDGTRLVAESRDGTMRLWDVATRRAIGPALGGHVELVTAMEPTGPTSVVTGGANDQTVMTWDLTPEAWVERACALAGRNLSRAEWDAYVGGEYRETCEQWPGGT